ncbi:MAG TPA: glycosyltransferase WbuB [Bacteroidales bacterium]|nr:glycosyltransferase WbuB [Bacteroidales bacterium]
MHVLYIHQYFTTPKTQGGTRSYEFARHLIKKGHKVTMITSGLHNTQFPVAAGQCCSEYVYDDICILALNAGYNDGRYGTGLRGWQRMFSFMSFAKAAVKAGKSIPQPDIVFATHTPLNVGFTGIKLRKYFNVPFVFEVRDLWPEAMVNIGAIKNPFIIALLKHWSRKIYFKADAITAASPGMKEGILKYGIPEEKVTVITQGCDLDLFRPDRTGEGVRNRLGLDNRFAAIYFGAMGLANSLDYAVEAANILKERGRNDIAIVLHGDGGKRDELEQMVKAYHLDNVIFSSPVPAKEELAEIVSACNVCLTIYRASKEHSWSPNKLFDALAAGKPILVNVPGWLGTTIENNKCGFATNPADPADLADKLEKLADNKLLVKEFGRNSRGLAEKTFSRAIMGDRLEQVFLREAGRLK